MSIKPIETRYRGYRFRSRIEARWAVFMDQLGVPWEYEPQGYVVDGEPYLPDFLVHPNTEIAFWLEIKGIFPDDAELAKAKGLAEGSGIPTYVYWAKPEPPAPDLSHLTMHEYCGWDRSGYLWVDDSGWCEYPTQPPAWQLGLTPTAFQFSSRRNPETAKSGFWWWTDCPHCGQAILKLGGQIGWCPRVDDSAFDELVDNGQLYPRFAHRTPRLLAAYEAARSARFEHGESPHGGAA